MKAVCHCARFVGQLLLQSFALVLLALSLPLIVPCMVVYGVGRRFGDFVMDLWVETR